MIAGVKPWMIVMSLVILAGCVMVGGAVVAWLEFTGRAARTDP